jgi:hypothetical protein
MALASHSVDEIKKKIKWNNLSIESKMQIKHQGRPMPDITVKKVGVSRSKSYVRNLKSSILYKEQKWVCGYETSVSFFCIPCLLNGGNDAWSKRGVSNPQKISLLLCDHEKNKLHVVIMFKFQIMGTQNIQAQLNSAYLAKFKEDNMKIANNRELLPRIIDCMRFCGAFELALRGHREGEDSSNPGIFLGLINFTAELDSALKLDLDNSTVFKGTSKTIQNELLQCMLKLVREEINNEIQKSNYVALIADETIDVSNSVQLVTLFRYIDSEGNVCEKFWGFCIPEDHKAESITQALNKNLTVELGLKRTKLIAQGYDGASVMRGNINGVQTRIKEEYPNAQYIHCQCHQLNLVMQRACSANEKASEFFVSLNGIPVFFANSSDRNDALESFSSNRIPHATPVRWNYKSRTANVVFEQQDALYNCFCKLESTGYTQSTREGAINLKRTMDDPDFCNWLSFFHKVMPHVGIIYSCLQGRNVDAAATRSYDSDFVNAIQNTRV